MMYRTAAIQVATVSTPDSTTMNQCHANLHLLNPLPFTCKGHNHATKNESAQESKYLMDFKHQLKDQNI
jgi:hypothetical protein